MEIYKQNFEKSNLDPKIFTKGITPKDKLDFISNILQYEQRSEGWYTHRNKFLTSSDLSTVLNLNPYEKPIELLFKKCGTGKPFTGNVATLHGQKHEDPAIDIYCKLMGKTNYNFGLVSFDSMNSIRVKHPNDIKFNTDWIAGSPDGIAIDNNNKEDLVLLEVKCPYRRKIVHGYVPIYYMSQCQMNMAIFDIDKCDFIEYVPSSGNNPLELNIVRVHRDHKWFEKNAPILEEFWNDTLYWRTQDIKTHPDYEEFAYKPEEEKPKSNPKFIESYEDEDMSSKFTYNMFRK